MDIIVNGFPLTLASISVWVGTFPSYPERLGDTHWFLEFRLDSVSSKRTYRNDALDGFNKYLVNVNFLFL